MRKRIAALTAALVLACLAPLSGALALSRLENPALTAWADAFTVIQLAYMGENKAVDLTGTDGVIYYNAFENRISADGQRVADGATFSEDGNYMLGMGAGVNNDALWYVTMTFRSGGDAGLCRNMTECMLLSFEDLAQMFGEDPELMEDICDALVHDGNPTGIQLNGKVLFRKPISETAFIIGVSSLEFYRAFYYGTLGDYINLDE